MNYRTGLAAATWILALLIEKSVPLRQSRKARSYPHDPAAGSGRRTSRQPRRQQGPGEPQKRPVQRREPAVHATVTPNVQHLRSQTLQGPELSASRWSPVWPPSTSHTVHVTPEECTACGVAGIRTQREVGSTGAKTGIIGHGFPAPGFHSRGRKVSARWSLRGGADAFPTREAVAWSADGCVVIGVVDSWCVPCWDSLPAGRLHGSRSL